MNELKKSYKLFWQKLVSISRFLSRNEVETIELQALSLWERFLYFWIFVVREFFKNRSTARATALAYTTLLGLVPLFAVMISVGAALFKNYYSEERIADYIDHFVAYVAPQLDLIPAEWIDIMDRWKSSSTNSDSHLDQQNVKKTITGRQAVAKTISRAIQNVQSGTLSVTGVLALIVIAIMMLSTIEGAFNDIWGSHEGRPWPTKLVLYWTAITLWPMVILAGVLIISSRIKISSDIFPNMPFLGMMVVKLLPYGLVTIVFTVLYKLLPNTQVQWGAAFIGGAVGGILWVVNNILQGHFVNRVIFASALYGSLATLPIFLAGLYISWLVLLVGAQTAYVWQNREIFWQEPILKKLDHKAREIIAVATMGCICRRFYEGDHPPTLWELAQEIGIPIQLVAQCIRPLKEANLIVEINSGHERYLPARNLSKITLADVLKGVREYKSLSIKMSGSKVPHGVLVALQQVWDLLDQKAQSFTFEDLIKTLPSGSPF